MRNTPSFFGEFNNPKTKSPSKSQPPAELKIEKEANLREKRKQILQRLKEKTDGDPFIEAANEKPRAQIDGISEKVIFSPRTAKRFQEASQRREITYFRGQLGSGGDVMPTIVLEEALSDRGIQASAAEKELSKFEEPTITNEEVESALQGYIPSFTEKTPLRKLQESSSPSQAERAKTSPGPMHLSKRNFQAKRASEKHDGRNSNPETPRTERKVYLDKFNDAASKPPLLTSNSLEVSDKDLESSPLRRSASFHSLKDRDQARRNPGRAQLLSVDDGRSSKTASLPSVRLPMDIHGFSSTNNLKLQQDKLEEDFHKLEEDLDRAFSELRNYLKTG